MQPRKPAGKGGYGQAKHSTWHLECAACGRRDWWGSMSEIMLGDRLYVVCDTDACQAVLEDRHIDERVRW